MKIFEWTKAMSVGVESIDNDHKTILLLMNEISEAINHCYTSTVIKSIFEKLEEQIKQHFYREELLLEQCNYSELNDHKIGHEKFISKIYELKKHLLSAENIGVAQEINLTLTDWLMKHIIADLSYAKTVHDHGLATTSHQYHSYLKRIYRWIGKIIILDKRVFLSTLVPIIALIMLSVVILWYSFVQYNKMQQLQGLTDLIRNINTLTHSLQTERGLSTGYISSNYQQFSSALKNSRNTTDIAVKSYQKTVKKLMSDLIYKAILSQFSLNNQWLVRLSVQRNTIDHQRSKLVDIQHYYTEFIMSLMSIFDTTVQLNIGAELTHNISAISAMINLKEAAGLERAIGMQMLAKGKLTAEEHQKFVKLIGKQEGLLKVFKQAASNLQKNRWKLLVGSDVFINKQQLELSFYEAIVSGNLPSIDSKYWFKIMSNNINQIKLLIDQLLIDVDVTAKQKVEYYKNTFLTLATVIFFILLIAFSVSWLLNQSILYPIRRFTKAMTRLSKGYRDVRFTDDFAYDDFRKMFEAYEKSRCKLLQADIFSTLRFQRQASNMEQKEREKEKYLQLASIDVLTGAINRRKFNELAGLEFIRVKRYQRGLSVMMLDIDHFKNINDSYGHARGDSVLKAFYQCCANSVRETDIVARIGGEEFVILLPETKLQQTIDLAERICIAVENLNVRTDDAIIKLTVSIGVSTWSKAINSIDAMIEHADKALYKAKNTGRNRVIAIEKQDIY